MSSSRRSRGRPRQPTVGQSNEPTLDGMADMMDTFREMASTMREQATVIREQQSHMNHNNNVGEAEGNNHNQEFQKFSEFKRAHPPEFRGEYNPTLAEEWIEEIEKVFSVFPCTEEQKVAFATYMLKAAAEHWWRATRQAFQSNRTQITWARFKDAFYDKYFPISVRNAKELEFLRLRQGPMSIAEYVAKFEELSKFSPYLQEHPNEEWKCVKFEEGLKERIQRAVGPLRIRDFPALVDRAQMIEGYDTKFPSASSTTHKGKFQEKGNKQGMKGRFQPYEKPRPDGQRRVVTGKECPKCGNNHGNKPCLAGEGICYTCRKSRHMSRECPNKSTDTRAQYQGRVFTLNAEDAEC